jgi:hypothetical protein
MLYRVLGLCVVLLLIGCGGPSEAQLQATVAAAVKATEEANNVATAVAATQLALEACGSAALTRYADATEKLVQQFDQQAVLVSSTPRVSMGVPMQRLLDIRTETDAIIPPECLVEFHEQVTSMMGMYQLGYQNFAAQGDEITTQAALQVADDVHKAVVAGFEHIRQGAVPPTPTPVTTR